MLDTIKGVAITLVVFGHCIQVGCGTEYIAQKEYWDNTIFIAIYAFHMPLFALVSGYLIYPSLQRYSFAAYSKKQLLNIGLPLLCWSVIGFSLAIVKNEVGGNLLKQYFNYLMGNLWFLRILLVDSLLIAAISYCCKTMKKSVIAFMVVFVVSLFCPDIFHYNRDVYLFPYLVLGYVGYPYLKDRGGFRISWFTVAVAALVFIVLMLGFNSEYIYSYPNAHTYLFAKGITMYAVIGQLYIDCYRWIIGFAGCFMVLTLSYKVFSNVKTAVSEIGKLSLAIYILSVLVYNNIMVMVTGNATYNVLLVLVETVVIIALCVVTAKLLCFNKYIGKALLGNTGSTLESSNK